MCYSWALPGQRKHIPYEHPRNRRVNVLAALRFGSEPQLVWRVERRTLTGQDVLEFIAALPPAGEAKTVVLDNASIHKLKVLAPDWAALAEAGLERLWLPGYSPELNDIERVFRTIKHHDLVERTYWSIDELAAAVEAAFARYDQRLRASPGQRLREAA